MYSSQNILTHAGAADTLLVLGTCIIPTTGSSADATLTEEARGTIIIPLACSRYPVAFHFCITSETWRAGAHFLVVLHVADGVEATSLILVTQVCALTTLT